MAYSRILLFAYEKRNERSSLVLAFSLNSIWRHTTHISLDIFFPILENAFPSWHVLVAVLCKLKFVIFCSENWTNNRDGREIEKKNLRKLLY